MPVSYFVVLVISVIAALLATIPELVVNASLQSLGLAWLVFAVAANLWWMVVLAGPVIWFWRKGRPGIGLAASLALAAMVAGGFTLLRAHALEAIAAPQTVTLAGALVDKAARTVEVRLDAGRREAEDVPCEALCEGLLLAGAEWVRVTGPGSQGEPEAHLFRSAGEADCRALDAGFPDGAPCILLGTDSGDVADLLLRVEVTRDSRAAGDGQRGLAVLVQSQRLVVTDQRDGTVLHDEVSRKWRQVRAPVLLLPNLGRGGSGLEFSTETKADPLPDKAEVLQSLGQPFLAVRPWVETRPAGAYSPAEGYAANLPQDRALMLSILAGGDGVLAPGLVRQVDRWLRGLRDGAAVVPGDRPILVQLQGRLPFPTRSLDRLRMKAPQLFVANVGDLYRTIREGDEPEALAAAQTLLNLVRNDPPGTHAGEAEDFLAALESGRYPEHLFRIVGLYGFDPAPVLRGVVDASDWTRSGASIGLLLTAACLSDPKWAGTLGPFVMDLVVPELGPPFRARDVDRHLMRNATQALMALGRKDLAIDLRNRVAPEALVAAYAKGLAGSEPRTPDELRDMHFGRLEEMAACR